MSNPPPQTSLFVGNLDPRVYRQLLSEIFSLAGPVTSSHIVFNKTTGQSSGYGFVHYADHDTAQAAIQKFRGRSIYDKTLTIDWARISTPHPPPQSTPTPSTPKPSPPDESSAYCLFVGNLSLDISDSQLLSAFNQFGNCLTAKCARDPHSNKTQGFAFVSFSQRAHAAAAMEAMNGQVLNSRPLRVEWAKGKTNAATRAAALGLPDLHLSTPAPSAPSPNAQASVTSPAAAPVTSNNQNGNGTSIHDKPLLTYETIAAQTSPNNITAYVAGLSIHTPESKIRERFARYGEIREIRIPESVKAQAKEAMYAFVRYHEHESAARAIFECQRGAQLDGRPVQVQWGRESVRRVPSNMLSRGHGAHFGGGYHTGGSGGYQHGGYARAPYGGGQQGYSRGQGPGPMYQQSHGSSQHRYRPY